MKYWVAWYSDIVLTDGESVLLFTSEADAIQHAVAEWENREYCWAQPAVVLVGASPQAKR